MEPLEKEIMTLPEEAIRWVLNSDGASNKCGARIRVVLKNSSEVIRGNIAVRKKN